eukprot:TRINITY_DN105719_c0_g1_i1.p1 TRINITY_DN105719_c0_g1~~TRINITY_DN105719_c0_g1_i1.p1  ORF type:complete len:589 (+),score=18.19 TRINITY_DN105719_c0_g1_i1:112-1878(+)
MDSWIDILPELPNFDTGDIPSCRKRWSRRSCRRDVLPKGRCSHSATKLDDFRYLIVGGGSCAPGSEWTHYGDAHIWDIRTEMWSELAFPKAADVAGENVACMSPRRGHLAGLLRPDEVIIFGGACGATTDHELLNDSWLLDVAAPKWRLLEATGSTPLPRRGASGGCVMQHLIVIGGYTTAPDTLDKDLYALNAITRVWFVITMPPNLRCFALASSTVIGNDLFIFGGSSGLMRLCFTQKETTLQDSRRHADGYTTSNGRAFGRTVEGVPFSVQHDTCLIVGPMPFDRFSASMCAIGRRWLAIFGGTSYANNKTHRDLHILDTLQTKGSKGPPIAFATSLELPERMELPQERNGCSFVGFGLNCVLFGGGVYGQSYYNDTWILNFDLTPKVAKRLDESIGSDLRADMSWLLQSAEGAAMCDVVVLADGCSFNAHRAILAARCEYFRAMLCSGFKEAVAAGKTAEATYTIEGVTEAAFATVLRYIYSGEAELPENPFERHGNGVFGQQETAFNAAELDAIIQPITDLLVCADRLGLLEVKLACEQWLCEALCTQSILHIQRLAEDFSCCQLLSICRHFFKAHKRSMDNT